MSGTHNKNMIFYSHFPHDKISKVCLDELDKTEDLNKQFIKICVHHPQDLNMPNPLINLPDIIKQLIDQTPILAIAGFTKPIFAQEAYNWLKNGALKQNDNPNLLKDGSGLSAANVGSTIADDCSTLTQAGKTGSEFFNTDYNMGFSTGEGEIGKDYANIGESSANRIMTYDDDNSKGDASSETHRKMDQLKSQRMSEVPQTIQRIGGEPGMMSGGMMGGGMGGNGMGGNGMPQMPNIPQSRNMSQAQAMPQIPQMHHPSQMATMGQGFSGPGQPQLGGYHSMPRAPQQQVQPREMPGMPGMPQMPSGGPKSMKELRKMQNPDTKHKKKKRRH